MKEKILKNLSYFFSAGLGLFTLIIFAFPYLKMRMKEDIFTVVLGTANGYSVMGLFDYKFAGVISSILQILILSIAVAMLVYGIIGLLCVFVKDKKSFLKIGTMKSQTLVEFGMLIYSALNALLMIFLIIICAQYNQDFVERTSMKLITSIGVYLAMFVPILAFFALKFFAKEDEEEIEEEEVENEEGLTLDDVIPTAQNMRK